MTNVPSADIVEDKKIKLDPWKILLSLHSEFLNSLDCIYELFKEVTPVLEIKDKEREERIKELSEEIHHSDGRTARLMKSFGEAKEVFGHIRKMRKADQMFRHNIIVSVVSKFDEFLGDVLRECYTANPNWLKNPNKTITYKSLFEAESIDRLRSELIQREVELLMRDSHDAQLGFIDKKLKLGLQEEFDGWMEVIEITERRNLFVHNGGCVNDTYLENAVKFKYPIPTKTKVGDVLPASDTYISIAIDHFYELSVRVVQGVVRRLYSESFKDADRVLNNASADLLSQERWLLAEKIFAFALGIPEKLTSKNEWEYYWRINYCIALKFSGKPFSHELGVVQWAAFHPKYHFAVAILEDRYEDAARLMQTEAVQDQVDRDALLEWPLLHDFRKTDIFQDTFESIHGALEQIEILKKAESELKAEQSFEHGMEDNTD